MWHSKFLRLQRLNKFQNKCTQFGSKGTFSYCQHYKLILKADSHCLLAFLYINANKAPETKSVNFFCSIFSLPSAASAVLTFNRFMKWLSWIKICCYWHRNLLHLFYGKMKLVISVLKGAATIFFLIYASKMTLDNPGMLYSKIIFVWCCFTK